VSKKKRRPKMRLFVGGTLTSRSVMIVLIALSLSGLLIACSKKPVRVLPPAIVEKPIVEPNTKDPDVFYGMWKQCQEDLSNAIKECKSVQ